MEVEPMPSYKTLKKGGQVPPGVVESETVVPLGAEGAHHLIIGRFPVLGFFIPDLFNGAPLCFGHGLTGDLLKPVAGILPVASGVLLNELPDAGEVEGDGGVGHGVLPWLTSLLYSMEGESVTSPVTLIHTPRNRAMRSRLRSGRRRL